MFDLSSDLEIFENTTLAAKHNLPPNFSFGLKLLSDEILNSNLKIFAAQERKIIEIVLWHIAEVDSRKLYAKMGFSSLFDYLVTEIGYSNGTAQSRIDSARLLIQVPEVARKIGEGKLNLTQVSKVAKICRQLRKDQGVQVSAQVKREVLTEIENKGERQTDLILAQTFNIPLQVEEKQKIQKDDSVRIELTLTKEEMALINKAKELLSNKTGGKLKDTIVALAEKLVQSFEVKKSTSTYEVENSTVKTNVPKTITPKLRKEIYQRDHGCCQFKDPKTQKTCGARSFLEIDHITPKFAGGDNKKENLRLLCRTHNQYRYKVGAEPLFASS